MTNWFPKAIWTIPNNRKEIFLTFDDGPIPKITPWVLDILNQENIKATFFCVGDNVAKYPELYQRILDEGHVVGNHTFNHVQGLKMSKSEFINNVNKARKFINSQLFRPPHGWLKRSQYKAISKQYKIVMWDVISVDYNPAISPKQCLQNVLEFTRSGSIITFHDSLKAEENLKYALPRAIKELKAKGFQFNKIEFEKVKQLYTDTQWGRFKQRTNQWKQKWA
ncbi:polysaccharide deacetylase family protein [Prolixibacteraceae bacterium JC049]|nr:polysaccharide deacetylase family protein [Prolixibacteraceae bacterium JC049]